MLFIKLLQGPSQFTKAWCNVFKHVVLSKTKTTYFTTLQNGGKQQIVTLEKLEAQNWLPIWHGYPLIFLGSINWLMLQLQLNVNCCLLYLFSVSRTQVHSALDQARWLHIWHSSEGSVSLQMLIDSVYMLILLWWFFHITGNKCTQSHPLVFLWRSRGQIVGIIIYMNRIKVI